MDRIRIFNLSDSELNFQIPHVGDLLLLYQVLDLLRALLLFTDHLVKSLGFAHLLFSHLHRAARDQVNKFCIFDAKLAIFINDFLKACGVVNILVFLNTAEIT